MDTTAYKIYSDCQGVTLKQAAGYLIWMYHKAGGNIDFAGETLFEKLACMQPYVLDRMPIQVRFELMQWCGFDIGDN